MTAAYANRNPSRELGPAPERSLQVAASESATPESRLRELMRLYMNDVMRALYRMGVPQSDLDDATQQAFIAVARHLSELRTGGERQYLLGIAARIALQERRTRFRRHRTQSAYADATTDQRRTHDFSGASHARQLLMKALGDLPDSFRAVFVLYELEQLSVAEIAEALDIPVGTVGSRLRRARDQFKRVVAEMEQVELGGEP